MTNLTQHFTLEELTASTTAIRLGINNTPNAKVITNLTILAKGLESVRSLLGGHPISIDSGYRCPALNKVVNGSATSGHLLGYAADFLCPAFGNSKSIVAKIMTSNILFDQCIMEGTWVHISFDPRMRQEILTKQYGQTFLTRVTKLIKGA